MKTRLIFSILVFCITAISIRLEVAVSLDSSQSMFVEALRDGDAEWAKRMFLRGVDPNFTHEGFPALHLATSFGNPEMVKLLIREGARIDETDKHGNAALHYAVFKGYAEVTRMLVDNYANLNIRNGHGQTALQIAEELGQIEIEKILLRAGAKTETAEDRGLPSLTYRPDLGGEGKDFWKGAKKEESFQGGFQYGFERGIKGDMPSYFYLLWFAIIAVFGFASWQGAKKRNRNPWIWGGLTVATFLLPASLLGSLCHIADSGNTS